MTDRALTSLPEASSQHLGAAVHADVVHALAEHPLQSVHVRLLEHEPHQLRTLDHRHAGVVGHEVRDADLPAEVHGDEDRREVLAGGVHGGREAGRSAADHRHVPHLLQVDGRLDAEHLVEGAGRVEIGQAVVPADPLVVDEELRHAALAGALDHLDGLGLVVGDVHLVVLDALGAQQRLGLGAVRAPLHRVHLYSCHRRLLRCDRTVSASCLPTRKHRTARERTSSRGAPSAGRVRRHAATSSAIDSVSSPHTFSGQVNR